MVLVSDSDSEGARSPPLQPRRSRHSLPSPAVSPRLPLGTAPLPHTRWRRCHGGQEREARTDEQPRGQWRGWPCVPRSRPVPAASSGSSHPLPSRARVSRQQSPVPQARSPQESRPPWPYTLKKSPVPAIACRGALAAPREGSGPAELSSRRVGMRWGGCRPCSPCRSWALSRSAGGCGAGEAVRGR